MPQIKDHLRLGTRGSPLALAQSRIVADDLMRRHAGLRVEMVIVKTTGDAVIDRPLYEVGGKGVFTKEIELALLRGEIDFAVHSLKDMPVTMPLVDQGELVIAAIHEREDARDVLVSSGAMTINELPRGARVGSSSLRRRAQLLALRPDLYVEPVRGNIDSRVKKFNAGEFDAIVLAAAGINRLGIWDASIMICIDLFQMLPAAGQGALAIQCRADDAGAHALLGLLEHAPSRRAVELERQLIQELHGDCHSPIGVYVEDARYEAEDDHMRLMATVAGRGGVPPLVYVELTGGTEVAVEAASRLKQLGAMEMLHCDGR